MLPILGIAKRSADCDFPLRSAESRAAVRAMLNAREAESDVINVHIEVVGFGPDPDCRCRACRVRWSQARPDERAAARVSLQNYVDRASGGTSTSPCATND